MLCAKRALLASWSICYETQALQLDVVDEIATGALLSLDGYAVRVLIAKNLAAPPRPVT
jgi:hypothetical protein